MHVVLLLQSGDDGPVKVALATDKSLERVVERLQQGNPDQLHIRDVLDGDERLAALLAEIFAAHRRPRGWHEPRVLEMVPGDVGRYDGYDDFDEQRRQAVARISDPAEWET